MYKAYIQDYELIFGGYSDNWNGAVASIIEKEGEIVKGSCVTITDVEVEILDNFESSYERQEITIKTETDEDKQGFVYVKIETDWDEVPSIDYLNACFKTIVPFGMIQL